MSKRWIVLGAIILMLVVVSLIYSATKTEIPTEITPTTPTIVTTTTIIPTSTSSNTLSDSEKIEQLILEYHELVKSESLEQLVELFIDDAKLSVTQFNTYRFSGKNQIRNYFGSRFEAVEGPTDIEVIDTSISIDGLKAMVNCKVAADERFATETFELVKVGDIWKISSLNMILLQ